MKLYLSVLLIAVALAGALAIVGHVYGPHSTPGIWLAVANFPGVAIGVWAALSAQQNLLVFYAAIVTVNSAFYFVLVKGCVWLKRKIRKSIPAQ